MTERRVVDRAALERLREWGGAELPSRMIELFLEHAPQRMEQIRRGAQGGGLRAAELGAHSLKSTAGNVGALDLSDLAAEAEGLARVGDAQGLAALLPQMETALQDACRELEALLRGERT